MCSPTRPVTTLDKSAVLPALFASWEAIEHLLTDLSDERWAAPTALPGWAVHDVASHVIGTESMLMGLPTPEADVDLSALPHVHNDIGHLNESWVRALRGETPDGMRLRLGEVTAQRSTMLTSMVDDVWNAVTMTPAGPDSYGRFMRIRIFDCWMHEQDIREAVDRPATDEDLAGVTAQQALDEMAASMGFVVGKRGKAPEGARVALELTGPLQRTIRVAVDGRAAVVDDFGGAEPTVTIRVDGWQFTRLCGGRPLSASRPAAVEVLGDEQVGRRIVDNLSYVI